MPCTNIISADDMDKEMYQKLLDEHRQLIKDNERNIWFCVETCATLITLTALFILYYFFGEDGVDVLTGKCQLSIQC